MSSTPSKTAIITGAGSGIGRATALRLAKEGWQVALLGRRFERLQNVAAEIGSGATAYSVDVSEPHAVSEATGDFLARHGRIDALVASAGMNVAERSWQVLSMADYARVRAVNLDGVVNCVQAVLPAMKRQACGTIVVINSEAGKTATAKAGAAYNISKFGLSGLVQSINAEERANGIRAVSIFPGDVNTPLLDKRPEPPPPEVRDAMVQPEDIAECVWLAVSLPPRAIVEELIIRPAY